MGAECQVCGKPAAGEGTVEGARVPLCEVCSNYAGNFSFYRGFVEEMQKAKAAKMKPSYASPAPAKPQVSKPKANEKGELLEDYGKRIMQARDRQGFSRKDLARKLLIQEKQLEGFEQQKFKPDQSTIKKLEFALGIKLTELEA